MARLARLFRSTTVLPTGGENRLLLLSLVLIGFLLLTPAHPADPQEQATVDESPAAIAVFPIPPRTAKGRREAAASLSVDPGTLRLKAASFEPLQRGSPVFGELLPAGSPLRQSADPGGDVLLVQFDRAVDAGLRRGLRELGVRILDYVPSRAFLLRVPDEIPPERIRTLPGVRFTMPFEAGFRLGPDLFHLLDKDGPSHERLRVHVAVFADADLGSLASAVRRRFANVVIEPHGARLPRRLTLEVSREGLSGLVGALIRDPAVAFVEHAEPLVFHNDNSVWIGQSYDRTNGPVEALAADPKPYPQSATVWNHDVTGVGQIVAVNDDGLDHENCFFRDPARAIIPQFLPPSQPLVIDPLHRKVVAFNTPSGAPNGASYVRHGTHVSGTVAGDDLAHTAGEGTAGHDHGDGMAPGAKILFQDIAGAQQGACQAGPNPPAGVFEQAYLGGARISTNSYGSGGGNYDTSAVWIDTLTWDHPDYLLVFSAGNQGTGGFSNLAACKNCIAVGASENYDAGFSDALGILDPENVAAFSSVGPAADGRIKPDLLASGYFVDSNRYPSTFIGDLDDPACDADNPDVCFLPNGCIVNDSSEICHVGPLLGTSMSSPTVAGLAALVRQYFGDGFDPTGRAQPENAFDPSAALVKAVLLNGARNMTGRRLERRVAPVDFGPLDDAPSSAQGWGRVMLDDALYFAGDARKLLRFELSDANALATGESIEWSLSVTAATEPLKATLVWTDPPGSPIASTALVNDLDLELRAPDGTMYRGNQWTVDEPAVAGDKESAPDPSGRDGLNNVEGILIDSPQIGVYTAIMQGTEVPGYLDSFTQGFALVVTGAVESPECTVSEAPPSLGVVSVGSGHVDLEWDAVRGALGYRVYRNESFCRDPMPADHVVNIAAHQTAYGDLAVVPDSDYRYVVRAILPGEGCMTEQSNCVSAHTLPPPDVQAVSPTFGLNNDPTPITVTGAGFLAGARMFLGTDEQPQRVELSPVDFVDGGRIDATIPVGLVSEQYDVTVVNQDGLAGSRPGAFQVVAPVQKSRVYVTNHAAAAISVIDLETLTEVDRIRTRSDWNADLVLLSHLEGVVTRRKPVHVDVFNPLTGEISNILPDPLPWAARVVAAHPNDGRVFVGTHTCFHCPGIVWVFDSRTGEVLADTEVGSLSAGLWRNDIEILPDGSKVYVTGVDDGTVSVIDTATYTEIARPVVGDLPRSLAVSKDGSRVYVANYDSDTISVIDTATQAVVDTLDMPTNREPLGLALSPDGSTLFVGFQRQWLGVPLGIVAYDVATGAEIRSNLDGAEWKRLRFYEPQGKLFGIRNDTEELVRIDPVTLEPETSIALDFPRGMAFLEPVPPELSGVSPDSGCFGTPVTLSGTGFQGRVVDDSGQAIQEPTRVFFGELEATSVQFHHSRLLSVVAPQPSVLGAVDVRVANPSGTATLAGGFLYEPACDGLQVAPPVPDGLIGSPMRASRVDPAGSLLRLVWDVSTCLAADYHILYGALESVQDLTLAGAQCGLGISGSFDWSVAEPSDLWFLIVAESPSATEGTWGDDSRGQPRNGTTSSVQCSMV